MIHKNYINKNDKKKSKKSKKTKYLLKILFSCAKFDIHDAKTGKNPNNNNTFSFNN
jgi:hypothetical protein